MSQALSLYPSLYLVEDTVTPIIEGKIIFSNSKHGFEDSFNISLKIPAHYPYRFPQVEETDKRILRVPERHINRNGKLCFAADAEELITCKDGINLSYFIEKILIPHLAREVYVEIYKKYPHGERPHNLVYGNMDFYFEKMQSNDSVLILKAFCYIASNRIPTAHEPCLCGSGISFINCHEAAVKELASLPQAYITNEIKAIYSMVH
ncbi:MAG: hypothetical protein M3Q95_04890 [Bacteroidota bacterium]|nr:hypothetical protein [Bacteroidota bacterium]